jgi:hypothetical protein
MTIRPSSLPFLAQCPCWQSDQATGREDKEGGNARHDYLAALLRCNPRGNDRADVEVRISEDEAATVRWAADYIWIHAPSNYPLRVEHHVNPLDAGFQPIFENGGTLDAASGPELFDFKWRQRDYGPQMAAYALALFQEQGWHEVRVHVLYGEPQRAEMFTLTEEGAEKIVFDIVDRARAKPDPTPTPCEYCGWCAHRLTCKALIETAVRVASGYSEMDQVKSWHPSAMESGAELSAALWIWRNVLSKWGESVEYHAREGVLKRGLTLPGFEIGTKKGRAYVADVIAAFKLAGLPQDEFLRGCQVRLNTSKKYPNQLGLTDIYAGFHGIKATPAKKDLLKKLDAVVQRTKDSVTLRAVKKTGMETEDSDE